MNIYDGEVACRPQYQPVELLWAYAKRHVSFILIPLKIFMRFAGVTILSVLALQVHSRSRYVWAGPVVRGKMTIWELELTNQWTPYYARSSLDML